MSSRPAMWTLTADGESFQLEKRPEPSLAEKAGLFLGAVGGKMGRSVPSSPDKPVQWSGSLRVRAFWDAIEGNGAEGVPAICGRVMFDGTLLRVLGVWWYGDKLFIDVSGEFFPQELLKGAHVVLQAVVRDGYVFQSVPCRCVVQNKARFGAMIDVDRLCARFLPGLCATVKFRVCVTIGQARFVSGPLSTAGCGDDCFKNFVKGFVCGARATAVPDETSNGAFSLRLVGSRAVDIDPGVARAKSFRPFLNSALLQSLSCGGAATHAVARSMLDGSFEATVFIDGKGRANAKCVAADNEYLLPLAGVIDVLPVSLLNEGESIESNLVQTWYDQEHELVLDSMVDLDEICRSNGIEYCLTYGTLLGAVRHGGMIPWDNDADIFMTEENYLKLRSLVDSGALPDRSLDDWISIKGYPGSFGRFMDTRTTRLDSDNSRGHGGVGGNSLFIDVFYLVPIDGERQDLQDAVDSFLVYDELHNEMHRSRGTRTDSFVKRYRAALKDCDERGKAAVVKELQDRFFFRQIDEPTHYLCTASSTREGEIYPHELLEETTTLSFDGHDFICPRDYFKVLRIPYGPTFRRFPKDRHLKPPRRFISTQIPYRVIEGEYLQDCDAARALEDRARLKQAKMDEMIRLHETSLVAWKLHALEYALEIEDAFKAVDTSGLQSGDYRAVDDLFSQYYMVQLDSKHLYWPVYIPLSDDLLDIALENLLCNRGDTDYALQILFLRKELGGEMTARLDRICEGLELSTDMRDLYEYGDVDASLRLADRVLDLYPYAVEARMLKASVSIARGEVTDDLARYVADEVVRTQGVTALCVQAQLLSVEHRRDELELLIHFILSESDDGMVVRRVRKCLETLS